MIFLLLGFLLLWEFFWFPYYFGVLIFGETDVAIAVGWLLRFIFVVLLFISMRYYLHEELQPTFVPTRNYTYYDMLVLSFAYLSFPHIMELLISLLGGTFSSGEDYTLNWLFWLDIIHGVIIVPILEEIQFRWIFFILFSAIGFGQHDFKIKLTLNASIFSLTHWMFGYADVVKKLDYVVFIPAWALFGFMAYYVYHHTRKLRLVIFLHGVTNFHVLMLRTLKVSSILTPSQYWWLRFVISILTGFIVIWWYRDRVQSFFVSISKSLGQQWWLVLVFVFANILWGIITVVLFSLIFASGILLASAIFLVFVPVYVVTVIRLFRSSKVNTSSLM